MNVQDITGGGACRNDPIDMRTKIKESARGQGRLTESSASDQFRLREHLGTKTNGFG